jgi:competence protein ComEA
VEGIVSVPESPSPSVDADADPGEARNPLERLREVAEQGDWPSRWRTEVVERLRGPAGIWVVAVVAAAALGVGLFAVMHTAPGAADGDAVANLPMAAGAGDRGSAPADDGPDVESTSQPATSAAGLVVQIAGAVTRPGVFHLAVGARVGDLVGLAGGLSAEADADRIDLAAPLVDGALVYIPRRGELGAPGPVVDGGAPSGAGTGGSGGAAGSTGSAVIDLNSATADQLDSLPGVGPTTAAAIITYRHQHGAFRSVDDLADVSGIGPAKLAQIRPHVRV